MFASRMGSIRERFEYFKHSRQFHKREMDIVKIHSNMRRFDNIQKVVAVDLHSYFEEYLKIKHTSFFVSIDYDVLVLHLIKCQCFAYW